jgi:2-octaprenyl-6-methoxyphenol hydroxylase
MTKQKYDIVIAGGGIVGCAAALALAKHTDYSIAIVEAFSQEMQAKVAETQNATLATSDNLATSDKNSDQVHPSFDTRVVALAQESYSQLMAFGIDMDAVVTCPIQHIHVSDRGHLGQAQLKAHNGLGSSSTKDTSMGYVVSLAEMGTQVLTQIESSRIDYFSPFKITQIQREQSSTTLSIMNTSLEEAGGEQQQDASKQPTTIETSLVIIAEGAQSPTRALFKLSHDTVSYQQSAIIANVLCQRTHQNCAFERFTSQGPIAMLPMQTESGNQMSLVWTAETENANDIMRLSDAGFLQKLQGLFGDKLGKIKASSPRHSYPLSLVKTPVFAAHRVICMGNAAQSLHPIAGQGFNLGVRDIQGLLKSLKQEEGLPADPGSFELIHSYKKHRAQDKSSVIEATDGLVRIFSNQFFPLVVGRNISLLALNHAPALKDKLASFAMGRR